MTNDQKPSLKPGSAEEPVITVDGKQYSYYVAQEAIRLAVSQGMEDTTAWPEFQDYPVVVAIPRDSWDRWNAAMKMVRELGERMDALEAQAYGDDD